MTHTGSWCYFSWQAHEWELAVERARVWEAASEHGGARQVWWWQVCVFLVVGAPRKWECIGVRAPFGKLCV